MQLLHGCIQPEASITALAANLLKAKVPPGNNQVGLLFIRQN
jgi:hypothetical protein